MKRKVVNVTEVTPNKKPKLTLNFEPAQVKAGALHCAEYSSEIELTTDTETIFEEVLDIKSTAVDTIVLTNDGHVFVTNGRETTELKLPGKVTQICAGIEHAACLLADGTAFIWGSFESPSFQFRDPKVPNQFLPGEKIVQIVSGRDHLLALNAKGKVFSLGCGEHGQLGRVPERSSRDGGRRGAKLLLQPSRVHMKTKHVANRIWATRNASFYREANSGVIYGWGENKTGLLNVAKSSHMEMDFIFHPVQTQFKDVLEITENLILTERRKVLRTKKVSDHCFVWSPLNVSGIAKIVDGHEETFLINVDGEINEWVGGKLSPLDVCHSSGEDVYVLQVNRIGGKIFLLVA